MPTLRTRIDDPDLRQQVEALAENAGVTVVDESEDAPDLAIEDLVHAGRGSGPHRLLIVATESEPEVWQAAARSGAEGVAILPGARTWLQERLVGLHESDSHSAGRVVCVVGSRGGCGATTVAVGLARAAQSQGTVVIVDGDVSGPGLDLALGLDGEPGVRWPDLEGVRGPLPSSSLSGRLLHTHGLDLLSGGGLTEPGPSWRPVIDSLGRSHDFVVVDLPRFRLDQVPAGSAMVLVVPLEMAGLTSARMLLHAGGLSRRPAVALRPTGGPLALSTALDVLDGLTVTEMPSSRGVRSAADFGDLADAVTKGAFARACSLLAQSVLA